jgi:predicted SAM-dependent methyltransferase
MALPLAADSADFFLAFDIFEHLTNSAVKASLKETLRVGKVGSVLYAEIPVECYCPAVTHVQAWNHATMRRLFEGVVEKGRRWKLILWDPRIPEHCTFQLVGTPAQRRSRADSRGHEESKSL